MLARGSAVLEHADDQGHADVVVVERANRLAAMVEVSACKLYEGLDGEVVRLGVDIDAQVGARRSSELHCDRGGQLRVLLLIEGGGDLVLGRSAARRLPYEVSDGNTAMSDDWEVLITSGPSTTEVDFLRLVNSSLLLAVGRK